MLCHKCKEQIEVGEACTSVNVGGYTRYMHVGCASSYRMNGHDPAADRTAELERIAEHARTVH